MRIFEPHAHMYSRLTDDYERMALAGVEVIVEPAFWMGQPRTNVGSFIDYFDSIIGWEAYRAAQFGIHHFCTISLNPREANDDRVNQDVIDVMPRFLEKDGVVGVGEIGFDDMTAREEKFFALQLELAKQHDLPVLIHTPHRDKKAGVLRSIDMVRESGLPMERVIMDHNTEETVGLCVDLGCYIGFTIYPHTKMEEDRLVEIFKRYGIERMLVNSSADWGISDPLKVPKTAALMRRSGFSDQEVEKVVWYNPLAFYTQSDRLDASELERRPELDGELFAGKNTIRRG